MPKVMGRVNKMLMEWPSTNTSHDCMRCRVNNMPKVMGRVNKMLVR